MWEVKTSVKNFYSRLKQKRRLNLREPSSKHGNLMSKNTVRELHHLVEEAARPHRCLLWKLLLRNLSYIHWWGLNRGKSSRKNSKRSTLRKKLRKSKSLRNWEEKNKRRWTALENRCSSKHLRSESSNLLYQKKPWNRLEKRVSQGPKLPNFILWTELISKMI